MKNKKIFQKGVSLIEVMMVIAIISILTSIAVGGYFYFRKGMDIHLGSQKIANAIRQTQGKAKAMNNDDAWGINITTSQATIFKGINFSSRVQSYDENIPLQGLTSVSGITQIIFYKLTGLPYASSVGTLILGNGETTKSIQINGEGLISY